MFFPLPKAALGKLRVRKATGTKALTAMSASYQMKETFFGKRVRRKSWTLRPFFARLTPPRRASFFQLILINRKSDMLHLILASHTFLISFSSMAEPPEKAQNPPATFMLYYQPLFEFDEPEGQKYVSELKKILALGKVDQIKNILRVSEKAKLCLNFGLKKCGFKKDPVHNRIEWNKIALSMNYFCNKNPSPICAPLAKQYGDYMKKYFRLMRERKKKKK